MSLKRAASWFNSHFRASAAAAAPTRGLIAKTRDGCLGIHRCNGTIEPQLRSQLRKTLGFQCGFKGAVTSHDVGSALLPDSRRTR
jgi:hypothetical protein